MKIIWILVMQFLLILKINDGIIIKEKRNKGEIEKMTKAKTVEAVHTHTHTHTHTDSLNAIKIDSSRDRNNLLFCGMQN